MVTGAPVSHVRMEEIVPAKEPDSFATALLTTLERNAETVGTTCG